METAEFIWMNGELVPWEEAKIHCINHSFHYGGGVFEGIRFYETAKGPAVFRLREHMERLFYSAGVMGMKVTYSVEDLMKVTLDLISKNGLEVGYIRPLIYLDGKMGINPIGNEVNVFIACWSWPKYLGHDGAKVKISKYMRIHPDSTVIDAKVCGHYSNSVMASLEMQKAGAHEALFLDYEGNVAEGPGENVFLVKDGIIKTPGLGSILPGLTREAVMRIARDKGYKVREETLTKEDFYEADEAFFTGTAAEITPFASLDDHVYGDGKPGPIATELKEAFMKIVRGEDPEYVEYLSYV
jgi:branched-chain amino acid aminotransferase